MFYKHAISADEKKDASELRYQIYCLEKEWLSFENYMDNLELDIYDKSSENFIAMTEEGQTIGTLRLILNSPIGFQISNHFKIKIPDDKQNCAEISRLAVLNKYRNRHIEVGLFREAFQYCLKNNIAHYYAVVENNLLKYLRRLGFPFEEIGDVTYYMGGYNFPVYMNLEMMLLHLEKSNPSLFSYIMN